MNIQLWGYMAGLNLVIDCVSGTKCEVNCQGNGCYGTTVNCATSGGVSNSNCQIDCDASDGTDCPQNITSTTISSQALNAINSSIFAPFVDSVTCGEDSVTFDDYRELPLFLNASNDTSTIDNTFVSRLDSNICCLAQDSCSYDSYPVGITMESPNNINKDIVCAGAYSCSAAKLLETSQLGGNGSIICSGYYSCYNVTNINASPNGSVYCGGGGYSCANSTISNAQNVYCAGYFHTCTDTKIYGVENVYLFDIASDIYSSGGGNNGTINVHFTSYNVGISLATIYCQGNDTCNIICYTNEACRSSTAICQNTSICNIYYDPDKGINGVTVDGFANYFNIGEWFENSVFTSPTPNPITSIKLDPTAMPTIVHTTDTTSSSNIASTKGPSDYRTSIGNIDASTLTPDTTHTTTITTTEGVPIKANISTTAVMIGDTLTTDLIEQVNQENNNDEDEVIIIIVIATTFVLFIVIFGIVFRIMFKHKNDKTNKDKMVRRMESVKEGVMNVPRMLSNKLGINTNDGDKIGGGENGHGHVRTSSLSGSGGDNDNDIESVQVKPDFDHDGSEGVNHDGEGEVRNETNVEPIAIETGDEARLEMQMLDEVDNKLVSPEKKKKKSNQKLFEEDFKDNVYAAENVAMNDIVHHMETKI